MFSPFPTAWVLPAEDHPSGPDPQREIECAGWSPAFRSASKIGKRPASRFPDIEIHIPPFDPISTTLRGWLGELAKIARAMRRTYLIGRES